VLTSVIIPCWNALELTRVCLKQLVRRTTLDFELIVVDNGSADGTSDWLRTFRAKTIRRNPRGPLRRFHVVTNAENRGYPAAMNQGIRAARGGMLLFGNNDVAVTPAWLEHMQAALRAGGPAVAGVSALSNPPREPGTPVDWERRPWYRGIKGLERYAAAELLRGGAPVFLPAVGLLNGFWFLTRRSVIKKVGAFDERYGPGGFEDFDLQWRMREAGYRLGFAGRSYVHHVVFGCSEINGLKKRELYGPARAALLHEKFPETAADAKFR
jgi:GT2 family glycosyltransferase